MTTCITPISWLDLERHHLGELDASACDAVLAHLGSCTECRGVLDRIADDDRALPELVRPAPATKPTPTPRWYSPRPRTTGIVSGLALAAGILLVINRPRSGPVDDDDAATRIRTKGGDVSLTLVREDERIVAEAGGAYRDGERLKALVTCAPGTLASIDIAVFERGQVSFPLEAATELACGNSVPIAGAFRVTGREPMVVCLVWQVEGAIDRETIRRNAPELPANARCTPLEPVP